MLRKLRLRQKNGFLIKKRTCNVKSSSPYFTSNKVFLKCKSHLRTRLYRFEGIWEHLGNLGKLDPSALISLKLPRVTTSTSANSKLHSIMGSSNYFDLVVQKTKKLKILPLLFEILYGKCFLENR